jgi:FkbH-like protein
MSESSDSEVFYLNAADRFGDNGIVGVAIVKKEGGAAVIDTFLLSCRVIGRRIETALLRHLAEWSQEEGLSSLIGHFIPTAKNAPARTFLHDHGFQLSSKSDEIEEWILELNRVPFDWPSCIARTADASIR